MYSLKKGSYVVCAYDKHSPYGRMVEVHDTLEDAKNHILYQREEMGSTAYWNILHIKDMEWISV